MSTRSNTQIERNKSWDLVAYLFFFASLMTLSVIAIARIQDRYSFGTNTHAVESAGVCLAAVALTAWLLHQVSLWYGFKGDWLAYALVYNSLLIAIKLIISPAALSNSGGEVTSRYIYTGLLVAGLYIVGLWIVYELYKNRIEKSLNSHLKIYRLSWLVKLLTTAALIALAIMSRVVIANFLAGTTASDYLKDVFSSNGLILPVILAVLILSAIQSFELAAKTAISHKDTIILKQYFAIAAGLIIVYHLLWIIYTLLLFRWSS